MQVYTSVALVIMDPYEPDALMRFNASVFFMDYKLSQIILLTQQRLLTLLAKNLLWRMVSTKIVKLLLRWL